MIRIIYRVKGMKKPEELNSINSNSLIDVFDPDSEDIKILESKFKIPKEDIAFFLDPEETTRLKKERYGVVAILKAIVEKENKLKLTTLSIILTKENVILIHKERLDFLESLFSGRVKGFYTDKKTRVFLQVINLLVKYLNSKTKSIESSTEKVEEELLRTMKPRDFIKYTTIRRSLIYLNECVIENGKVLEAIMKGRVIKVYKTDKELLEDMIADMKQLIRSINVLNQVIASTMDGYASLVSLNIEKISKRLSAMALILSVFVGISSFYGMNVALPLQRNPHAFWIILTLSIIFSLIFLIVFKIKDWM